MASRTEVQEIVIERMDALWSARKDPAKQPTAYARACDGYFEAFRDTPAARLTAAMERTARDYTGDFWPTPAVIRRHMPEEISAGSQWTAMPASWKWDSRLPELRRLCHWDSAEDPLVALANALSLTSATDPWRTMRNAMATEAMAWEKYGDELWPTGPKLAILNARNLVEQAGRKVGIRVDLGPIPLDQKAPPEEPAPAERNDLF